MKRPLKRGARRLGSLVVAATLLFAGTALTTQAATAPPVTSPPVTAPPVAAPPVADGGFDTPTEAISAYGDFQEIGNSVLRCPVAGERISLFASPQSCLGASQRQPIYQLPLFGWGSNNGYYMQLAGEGQTNGPAGSTLFDESSASVRIPAGTTVLYAQLDWGGDTGSYSGTNSPRCQSPPYLLEPPSAPPQAPAASSPDAQPVTIAVGADPATQVPLVAANYTSSETSAAPVGMYSDWADVTSSFTDLGAGTPSTVSVGDVWAPTGYGCAAGWSLTMVFGATAKIPGYDTLRQFDVYAGHLRATYNSQASVTLAEPNIDPTDANVKLGVTAYDGDWNNASDTLLVDGTSVADPCGDDGSHDNFFSSCADGALDPLSPGQPIANNFSVDAKTVTPVITKGTADPGDIDIQLQTGSDVYLLQGLVVAEDINPSFTENTPPTFNKKNLRVGDTVLFTINGSNTGNIPLTGLVLRDQLSADCKNKTIGDLAPGQSYSVTCSLPIPNVTSLSDTATITATWPGDSAGLTASDQITFTEPVLGPQLTLTQSVNPTTVRSGDPVTVTFTVTNNGDADDGALTGVSISEPGLTGCAPQPIPNLPPSTAATLTCTAKPTKTVTSTAIATATDSTNVTLTATSGPVTVTVQQAALTITNYADPDQVVPSGTTHFTVTVHNTGGVALTVQVSNDNLPSCDFAVTGAGLAPGAARSEQCTAQLPATTGNFTDTASFTATPVLPSGDGLPIAGSAKGVVKITTTPAANPASGAAGGSGAGTAANGRLSGNTQSGSTSGGSATGGAAKSAAGSAGSASGGAGGKLAYTGFAVAVPLGIAGSLLVGGVLLVLLTRRRARQ